MERQLRLAERRGIFQRGALSRVQEVGVTALYDRDLIDELLRQQLEITSALKLALVANDSSRLPMLYPAYAPPDNTAAIAAIDRGAPVEIRSDVPVSDMEDFFDQLDGGSLGISEIDGIMNIDGGDW